MNGSADRRFQGGEAVSVKESIENDILVFKESFSLLFNFHVPLADLEAGARDEPPSFPQLMRADIDQRHDILGAAFNQVFGQDKPHLSGTQNKVMTHRNSLNKNKTLLFIFASSLTIRSEPDYNLQKSKRRISMEVQPVLIGGVWQKAEAPLGFIKATNPATRKNLKEKHPVSSFIDIEHALQVSLRTAHELRSMTPKMVAGFLDSYADRIERHRDALVQMASLEPALPAEPRLRSVELPRTTGQLRHAARACPDRSWCRATIASKNNIRSKHGALGGPVAIFGPGNFPFALNPVAGGGFAAAVASGNPVIAKAHPGHPGTTKILAEIALEVLKESHLPPGVVQLLYHFDPEDGLRLAAHALVGATAFTGSRSAGVRVQKHAEEAG